MIKQPKEMRIGGINYTLEFINNLWDGDAKVNGVISGHMASIKVEDGLPDVIQFVTMWHEAVHGILDHAGIVGHEEQLAIALGYGITAVLRDNPLMRTPPAARKETK